MQANFQLLTGDSAIGGGLQLPVTQSWTADNIVSYKSIGPSLCGSLDYAQPCASRLSTPPTSTPTLIPPDKPTWSPDAVLPVSSTIHPTLPHPQSPDLAANDSTTESPIEYPPADSNQSIPDEDLLINTKQPLSTLTIRRLHTNPYAIPDIRPCNTPAPCENRSVFDSLKLRKIFGCLRFRNQQHLTTSSANAKLINRIPGTVAILRPFFN